VIWNALSHHTIPRHSYTTPYVYHAIPYHTIPYHTIPYHTIPHDGCPILSHLTTREIRKSWSTSRVFYLYITINNLSYISSNYNDIKLRSAYIWPKSTRILKKYYFTLGGVKVDFHCSRFVRAGGANITQLSLQLSNLWIFCPPECSRTRHESRTRPPSRDFEWSAPNDHFPQCWSISCSDSPRMQRETN
jgi:hypothetical protein